MLDKLRKAKAAEIEELVSQAEKGNLPAPLESPRVNFRNALTVKDRPAIIAEYKRASPSKGPICSTLEVEDVACQYRDAGASAISVLTEKNFFDGDIAFINRAHAALQGSVPLLRKDFIFHPLQIDATAATCASAVLLIARFMSSSKYLRDMAERAMSFGIAPVIEIFDEKDLKMARDAGASIIQVNARDLQTLKTNRNLCYNLIQTGRPQNDEIWIAASGMDESAHIAQARNMGFDAVLIGTALMRNGTPGASLTNMLREIQPC